MFSQAELERYSRQIALPAFGAEAQAKLKRSRVLIVGVGGLGCPASLYLAAAGVGHLTLVDDDVIQLSNLQRQILFTQNSIAGNKASTASTALINLNSNIKVDAVEQKFSASNARALIRNADLVLDCSDNFATRYLLNDACLLEGKAWLHSSLHQFSGQCALFVPGGDCYRCLYPDVSESVPNCSEAGVLGVLPGILGTLQANEAIKYLCGLPTPLAEALLLVDALQLNFRKIARKVSTDCLCRKTEDIELGVADNPEHPDQSIEVEKSNFEFLLKERMAQVVDVREMYERQQYNIGGLHIPLADIERAATQLDKHRPVLCYCQIGRRSQLAAESLRRLGFEAYSLKGGLESH